MFENSIRLGTVAGIRIGVHYTWFIIFLLLTSTLYSSFSHAHPDWSGSVSLITAIVTALVFFVSIVLHELGHSIVALKRGISVRSITLFIFGGVAQTEQEAESAQTEFLVAIAGPLVSVSLAALFYILSLWLAPMNEVAAEALDWLATINLLVAVFNMVPGFPLDGGRVFRALVWGVTGDASKGMNWAVLAGKLVAYLLMGMGVMTVIQTGYLLNGIWLFGIGWFLLISAQASGQAFTINRVFHEIRARELMEADAPTVAAATNLSEWVEDYVFNQGERAFLVTENGQITGLLTLSDCQKVPRDQWAATPVKAVMTPAARLHSVRPDTDISAVLQLMAAHSLNQVPVTEEDQVIGWITRDRLIQLLKLHNEAGI
jgi:Zn-dependent protease/predicted transcriptional regulator